MRRLMEREKLRVCGAHSTAILILTCCILNRPPCSGNSGDLHAALTVWAFLATSRICPLVHAFPCLGPTVGYVQTVSFYLTPPSKCCCYLCKSDCPDLSPFTKVWIRRYSPSLV